MKKMIFSLILLSLFSASCLVLKETLQINQLIAEKEKIEAADNPASKFLILKNLNEKGVEIKGIVVRDITGSSNIDYDFCVVADVMANDKKIECFIYTKNVKLISKLKKGSTKINVNGEFGRFFTVFDDYYTRIEIVKASIKISEEK